MIDLALVWWVRGAGGDYALAGTLAAVNVIGAAIGAPALARVVDRTRQPPAVLGAAVLATVAFLVMAWVGPRATSVAAPAAFLAGLATPPLESCLRALWPWLVADRAQLEAAYGFDAAVQELVFTSGPIFVIVAVAVGGAAGGLLGSAAFGLVGAVAFAAAPPARSWRGEASARHWAGPLRSSELRWMLATITLLGSAIGFMIVAFPAYGEQIGARSFGGWLFAVNSFGSFVGGLVYGMLPRTAHTTRRLALLITLLALSWVPMVFTPPAPAMIVLALVGGSMFAPSLACVFVVVNAAAPAGTVAEAFAWVGTAILVGISTGSPVGGHLVDRFGAGAALAGGLIVSATCAGVLALRSASVRSA